MLQVTGLKRDFQSITFNTLVNKFKYIIYKYSQQSMDNQLFKYNISESFSTNSQPNEFHGRLTPNLLTFNQDSSQNSVLSNAYHPQNTKKQKEADLSFRSASSRTPSKLSYRTMYNQNLGGNSNVYPTSVTGLSGDLRQNYQNIERILKKQNENLKMQNQLLLKQVYKLKKTNQKYKEQSKGTKLQLQGVKLQCEAQKRRADQMKEIIMNRLMYLQGKINEGGQSSSMTSECESILEALTFSQSGAQNAYK